MPRRKVVGPRSRTLRLWLMRTLFHPALLHPPTGDPGAWIDLPDEGRAVLDLPSLAEVPARGC
jgi:hypothetical protein